MSSVCCYVISSAVLHFCTSHYLNNWLVNKLKCPPVGCSLSPFLMLSWNLCVTAVQGVFKCKIVITILLALFCKIHCVENKTKPGSNTFVLCDKFEMDINLSSFCDLEKKPKSLYELIFLPSSLNLFYSDLILVVKSLNSLSLVMHPVVQNSTIWF